MHKHYKPIQMRLKKETQQATTKTNSMKTYQGINWSKTNSKTDLLTNYKYQQEINQLKEEIKLLKQTKNNHQKEARETKTSNTRSNSKNGFQASVSHISSNKPWQLYQVTKNDPAGQGIKLSTERFFNDTFKLLNKNLNFVTTQKSININTINRKLEDFF